MRARIPLSDIIRKHNRKTLDEIDYIVKYIKESGNHIERLQNKINSEVEGYVNKSPQYWQEMEQENEDELYLINNFFPKLHFNSLFLLCYAFFESNLKLFCIKIENHNKYKSTNKKISNDFFIGKSFKYLTETIKLDLTSLQTHWNLLWDYKEIRNGIAHANSKMRDDKPFQIDNSLRKYISLDEQTGEFYINDDKFLFNFCALMKDYFNSLKIIIIADIQAKMKPNTPILSKLK